MNVIRFLVALAALFASSAAANTFYCPTVQIDGNQGTLYCTNFLSQFNTSRYGAVVYDIEYRQLVPASYGSPNIKITSASIGVWGVQTFNGGSSFLKVERPDSDSSFYWKWLVVTFDGQPYKQENHVPGIVVTPSEKLCFQGFWQAYPAGPDGFGGVSTKRVINIQIVFTILP